MQAKLDEIEDKEEANAIRKAPDAEEDNVNSQLLSK